MTRQTHKLNMTRILYNSESKIIKARIDGTLVHLNPVIKTLDYIGNIIREKYARNFQIVHHDDWSLVCPYRLHGIASMVCYYFRSEMPKINSEIVEFASTEIGLGNLSILKLERKKYEEQILRALDDIGKTWQYTENKEEAEELVRKSGIPLLISTKGLSEKERIEKFRLEYLFIDEKFLIENTLRNYDEAILKKNKDRKRFQSMNLDDLSLGIGLNLYEHGIARIKLYEE